MEAIRCENLTKRYGNITALDSLTLSVDERAIFGFLGPNGAGKTTTLRILTGLSRATGGEARVSGEYVSPNSSALQNKIGYLPEVPAFYNWMKGDEYLGYIGKLFRLSSGEIRDRSNELLELVDLTNAASRRIGGYSRGMRQRLGIAQALINRPPVLFLDEPCSALDPLGRAEILDTISRLKEQETTVFMSTHILADVERVCDTVGIIDNGRLIVESGIGDLKKRFARPAFELEFEEPASEFVDTLRNLPWVEKVDVEQAGDIFRVKMSSNDTARAKREIINVVAASGLVLRRYELVVPTLEEVFIELLGRKGD